MGEAEREEGDGMTMLYHPQFITMGLSNHLGTSHCKAEIRQIGRFWADKSVAALL